MLSSVLSLRTFASLCALTFVLFALGCDNTEGSQEASAEFPDPALSQGDDTIIIPIAGSTKGDFQLYPVEIPENGEFIIDLIRGPSPYSVLASVLHRGMQDGRTEIEVDMSGMGGLFTIEMRLDETVHYSVKSTTGSQPQAVGSLREQPSSYHFEIIEEDGERVVVIAVDYDRQAVGGGGVAWITPDAGGPPVPSTFLDVLPEQRLEESVEIAAVRMRGIGTGAIAVAAQHLE